MFQTAAGQAGFGRTKSLPLPVLAVKHRAKKRAARAPKAGAVSAKPSSAMNHTCRQFAA